MISLPAVSQSVSQLRPTTIAAATAVAAQSASATELSTSSCGQFCSVCEDVFPF